MDPSEARPDHSGRVRAPIVDLVRADAIRSSRHLDELVERGAEQGFVTTHDIDDAARSSPFGDDARATFARVVRRSGIAVVAPVTPTGGGPAPRSDRDGGDRRAWGVGDDTGAASGPGGVVHSEGSADGGDRRDGEVGAGADRIVRDARVPVVGPARERRLAAAVRGLDEAERSIVERRLGLIDGRPRTLEQVGSALGLAPDRVRRIEVRAFAKLRHPSSSDDPGGRLHE